jgi:hypothetical protein
MARPPLKVVRNPAGNGPQPPRPLGQHGQRLWNDLTREFDFSDRAGQELLAAACTQLDRAKELAEQISADSPVIRTRSGVVKAHPAILVESTCGTAVVRTLIKLGLTFEPTGSAGGRPPGGGI